MNDGKMIQVDTPFNLYNRPKNKFVASFMGLNNIFDGKKEENKIVTVIGALDVNPEPNWQEGSLSIRPEKIEICEPSQNENNRIRGCVDSVIFKNGFFELFVKPEKTIIKDFLIRVKSFFPIRINKNDNIGLFFPPKELIALD
jgi:ABC-type Fe3+/spermidine/putrescine transport system ATPase subunit